MHGARWLRYCLLDRETCVVQPRLVEEINDAVRPKTPGHGGNRVDNKAKVILASAQRLFDPFALSNLPLEVLIRRGKLCRSPDDTLFEFLVQRFYLLLGLHEFGTFEDFPSPMTPEDGKLVCPHHVEYSGRARAG